MGSEGMEKKNRVIRIGTINVGGFNIEKREGDKHDMCEEWTKRMKLDLVGISEVGINWRNFPSRHGLDWRLRKWKGLTMWTHNVNDTVSQRTQIGGCALHLTEAMRKWYHHNQEDPTGLGRWIVMEMNVEGAQLAVYQTYRCVKSKQLQASAWQQQRNYLISKGNNCDPTEQHMLDMENDIKERIESGWKVIVMGDFNEWIKKRTLKTQMEALGLREVLTEAYDTEMETFHRNMQKEAIDGIWMSRDLHILRGGYTNYGPWDHRTLWADVSLEAINPNLVPRRRRKPRKVTSNHPKAIQKYLKELERRYKKSRFRSRLERIATNYDRMRTVLKELNTMDKEREKHMKEAEAGSRKIVTNEVMYYPATHCIGKVIEALKTAIRQKEQQKRRHSGRRIDRLFQFAGMKMDWRRMNIGMLRTLLEMEKNNWKKNKKQQHHRREEFLNRKAKEAAAMRNTKKKGEIKMMKARERIRKTARSIRWRIKPQRQALTTVRKRMDDGRYQDLVDERSMVRACMEHNQKKYVQAYDSPLMRAKWRTKLGRIGEQKGAQNILNRHPNYDLGLPPGVQRLLQELGKPKDWKPHHICIDEESNKYDWKCCHEFVESSPSGLHMGLWKSNTMNESVNAVDTLMRKIPFDQGLVLERWRKGVDVELLKEEGNYKLEKLRTIVIVEADYNTNCKRLGREILNIMKQHEEDSQWNAQEQYGSKKEREASDVSLNTRLVDDVMRQTRTNGSICSNDAKSCYDRILHPILSICLQRLGIDINPIQSTLDTIQEMRHSIRTAFGDSRQTYQGNKRRPMQGLIQGNGMAPAGWAAISTPLINVIRNASYGFNAQTPITKEKIQIVSFSFVDDTDLVNVKIYAPPNDTERQLEQMVALWNEALQGTGGKLQWSKCHAHIVEFHPYSTYKARYCMSKEQHQVSIQDGQTGNSNVLPLLNPNETNRALGLYHRRDGNDIRTAMAVGDKANQWASRVQLARWDPPMMLQALQTTIWKSVEYVLASTCLTRRQCDIISSRILQTALPRLRIHRSASREALYTPLKFGGLGITSIYVMQMVLHIVKLAKHLFQPTMTGKLIRLSQEALDLELGQGKQLWDLSSKEFGMYTTTSWLTATWKATQQMVHRFKIVMPTHQWNQRENDVPIMTLIHQMDMSDQEKKAMNWCRMYCHVVMVSDLLHADGTTIHQDIANCTCRQDKTVRYNWPRTKKPGYEHRQQWKKVIQAIAQQQQLGTFTNDEGWMKASADGRVVEMGGKQYERVWVSRFHIESTQPTDQEWTQIVTGTFTKTGCFDVHSMHQMKREAPTEMAQEPDAVIVTDGGWKEPYGTAGIIIHQSENDTWTKLGRHIKNGTTMNNAYRCELGGLLCALQWCSNRKMKRIVVACDNNAALDNFDQVPTIHSSEWDLRCACFKLTQHLQCKIEKQYVCGHADRDHDRQLTLLEQMNVEADAIATAMRSRLIAGIEVETLKWDLEEGSAQVQGYNVTSLSRRHLYAILSSGMSRKYWKNKREMTTTAWRWVNWRALEVAVKRQSYFNRLTGFKIRSQLSPTRRQRFFRQEINTSECVFCNEIDRSYHGGECQHHKAFQQTTTEACLKELAKIGTPKQVCEKWGKGLNNEEQHETEYQTEIGWRNFRMGYIDKRWKRCIPSTKDAQVWSNKAVAIILEWMITMYNHHVRLTHTEEANQKVAAARTYVEEEWHQCQIPATETTLHPTRMNKEAMLERSSQELLLWQQLNQSYTLQEEDPED